VFCNRLLTLLSSVVGGIRCNAEFKIQNAEFKIQNWADEKYNFIIFVNWKEPL
jgi:hypothetical protein